MKRFVIFNIVKYYYFLFYFTGMRPHNNIILKSKNTYYAVVPSKCYYNLGTFVSTIVSIK